MNIHEQVIKSFSNKEDFSIFVDALENQGYIIDSKEEQGVPFSTTQIEHITQELYDELCIIHNITSYILKLRNAGDFYPEHGAFYIVYNGEDYEYADAKKILNDYISTLD